MANAYVVYGFPGWDYPIERESAATLDEARAAALAFAKRGIRAEIHFGGRKILIATTEGRFVTPATR
jgi:hypothetical protein